jgi:hypothetical protein
MPMPVMSSDIELVPAFLSFLSSIDLVEIIGFLPALRNTPMFKHPLFGYVSLNVTEIVRHEN